MPHVASASDFLLVRLPGGNIALRELTGCVTVGQQHPSVLIWAPFSAEALAYEKARFKVNCAAQATCHIFALANNYYSVHVPHEPLEFKQGGRNEWRLKWTH